MISPLDIQNKIFGKGVRGYKEEEVDAFLDLITLDLEKLIDENNKQKSVIKDLTAEVEKYRSSEGAVLETLEAAKALMSDISASAEKRAQILIKNAELDAELIQREARDNVERLNEETVSLRDRLNVFRTRYRSLLEAELEKFDTLSEDLFSDDSDRDFKSITAGIPVAEKSVSVKDFHTITNLRTGEKL